KAKAIVEYRKLNGAFKSPEDLKNVKGIGEGIFSKLKGEAVTSTPPAKKAGPALKK
ncbi:helix-hairpin-helix domain-containing protein, partial [Neisseria sp. ZJ104]